MGMLPAEQSRAEQNRAAADALPWLVAWFGFILLVCSCTLGLLGLLDHLISTPKGGGNQHADVIR